MGTFVRASEMTYRDFMDYYRDSISAMKDEIDILERIERDGGFLSYAFCCCYESLLEDRLCFCMTCSEYYRAMAEKSFWFMKPLVLRRAMKFESIHCETLGRLMLVRLYKKMFHGEAEGYSD